MDAWKALDDLVRENSTEVQVRPDITVEALGCERAVRLSLRYEKGEGLKPDRWHDTGPRNVSTMRKVARALLDACDFVDAANPEWASHHGAKIVNRWDDMGNYFEGA